MFYDDEITSVKDIPVEQYKMPVYQAIVEDPMKGVKPILIILVVSFFGLRWLMKS